MTTTIPAAGGIAAFPSIVLDCPDHDALARFYGAVLGWEVRIDDDWAEVRSEHLCLSFQPVAAFTPPRWPDQEVPQQMHLDLMVRDLDEGEKRVVELGARLADHQPGVESGMSFRVFLDPAGHPFCLCVS